MLSHSSLNSTEGHTSILKAVCIYVLLTWKHDYSKQRDSSSILSGILAFHLVTFR